MVCRTELSTGLGDQIYDFMDTTLSVLMPWNASYKVLHPQDWKHMDAIDEYKVKWKLALFTVHPANSISSDRV